MKNIIDQFNDFFGKDAHAVIENNDLKITIDGRTLIIGLPTIVGASSKGQLLKS